MNQTNYPLMNFSQILSNYNTQFGYNAAKDCYEDLMNAGIMDPTKVYHVIISDEINEDE